MAIGVLVLCSFGLENSYVSSFTVYSLFRYNLLLALLLCCSLQNNQRHKYIKYTILSRESIPFNRCFTYLIVGIGMMLRRSQTSAMREATIDTALYTIQKPVDIEAHSTAENKERKHVPYTTKKFLTLRQRNFYIVYILSILGIAIIFIAATSSIKRFTRSQSQKYINESVEPQRKGSALPWPESLNLIENKTVSPLGEYDYRYFTIRLNTWHRNEQLIASLDHHSQCEGVAQIQVIWCDNYNDPPHYVIHHPSGKVVVERHSVNSLNERFNMLLEPTTAGILSMDDDVIRPCFAIDAGFFRWTEAPKRMLGFDNRVHEIKGKQWSYGYLSTSEKRNEVRITTILIDAVVNN